MSTVALHQKYRPQTLAELVGQPYIKTALTNAIKHLQIAPAYLLTGSRGTGKTSTARIFAKSLNCLNTKKPTDKPCGICQSCRSIETSNSLDVSEIDAASNNGVDDARALIERCTLAPIAGRYRIFILDECHCLTGNAFNALLKCIEEPPPHVVFILCTTEQHKVLPTIVSRCQVFNFRTLSIQTIVQHLRIIADAESISINEEALIAIARLSDGGLRDALQLLGQASLLDVDITAHHVMEIVGGVTEAELMAILQAISTNNTFNLLQVARELVDSGKTPKLIISNLLQTYRDLLIIKSAPQEQALLTGCVSHTQLKAFAKHWNFETLNLSLAELQKAENYLRYTVNAAVWLEVCLLNLLPGLLPGGATKTVNLKPGHDGKLLPTFGTYTINKVTDKPVDDPGKDSLLPAVATNTANTSNTANLAQIWQQVMDKAKPNHQKLLAHANLVKLQGSKAILEVTPAYLQKFENSKEAIAKMLQRATQSPKPLTVLIKTANLSNNGRVRG
ncbi:DNA polymerase III subunit gamma/tau [Anabaena cylindrica FACHB-243]|uniref:DNA polymerase III subunit gamma/tau n=1 Tax=Anabaena cylindrica (strain ATCC 27899 / PCC 7122) TaxID=272123 RepID=K9ZEI8_ANACC|nr:MULTISPECIES: DNA polymerase III subunit gamma/tau [Anabaena]AFZ56760.1 DNA polymerase III, subunits gamma and tau [Anabaena cylindrica PCC 7122]MBD2416124.1 DNA polymerase III subunit gamma/tau [Anabaena cylindrica FACHB-243]MCM2410257.1 DNA polymerase III subunit gamma/tau [Anabaena sp. CCAP 1446/1C]BAY06316.1 DNA polymerase III gamma and tau subunits [Anabaena cylindrica PCC 7122]